MEEIAFTDEIPFGDEIRLDGGWVDLISSEAKPNISSKLAWISSLRQQGFHYIINIEMIAVVENKLADLSTEFAVAILHLTDRIK